MADIFISYARLDNKGVYQAQPIKEFVDNLKIIYLKKSGGKELSVFFDEESLELGAEWTKEIRNELESSSLLLAFLSPSYFSSKYCGLEWDYFVERKQPHVQTKLIIPIKYMQWDKKDFHQLDRINRIRDAEKLHHSTFEFMDGRIADRGKYESLLNNLIDIIIKRLDKISPQRDISNVHTIEKNVDQLIKIEGQQIDSEGFEKIFEKLEKKPRKYKMLPVCVIYTGGTVGMVRSDPFDKRAILITGKVSDLIRNLDRLDFFECDIDFYSYMEPLDSSNIDSYDWTKLANIISLLYQNYQGFVILHGTDTMSYTASALSFIFKNLNKPVVMTGAERPPTELGSDAKTNIMRAIQVAAPLSSQGVGNVPEVCILFGKKLMRGNKTKKKVSLHIHEGFFSPNYPALGTIEDNIVLHQVNILRKTSIKYNEDVSVDEELMLDDKITKDDVIVFEIYPDLNLKLFEKVFKNPELKGVILKTYGTGNAPTMPEDFLKCITQMINNGVIIVNLTQCPEGRVEVRLFETNSRLFDIGVINGGDMTAEAAYCKLKYLLGKHGSDENASKIIKQEMQIDLRGELQFSAYNLSYSHLKNPHTFINPVFSGKLDKIGDFEAHNIDHAFLRIQGLQPYEGDIQKQKEVSLRFYINRPGVDIEESKNDSKYRIGWFRRPIEFDKETDEPKEITHNLEVTRDIIRLVNPRREQYYSLQIVSENGTHFKFKTLELTIFTQRR
ncbi:asparaginase domain-containing protein [Acidobacteriota bacterium]